MIKVLIVDDQAMVREGFGALLAAQEDIEVVGSAADGAEAVDAVRRHRPDVVLMDVRMPVLDGLEATRRILKAPGLQHPRVIMLTTFDLDDYVYEALRAGASGFLLKDAPAADLVHAVRVVAAGDALLAPNVTKRLIAEFARLASGPRTPLKERIGELTEREREVLSLLTRGRSNAEIATDLFVSEATGKTHVAHVLMKLGVRDRVQAVIYAYEAGLVQPGAA